MVMPNTLKKENGDPDYFLYIKPNEEKQSGEKREERPLKAKTHFLHKFFQDFFAF
jgi:hypothetical protein